MLVRGNRVPHSRGCESHSWHPILFLLLAALSTFPGIALPIVDFVPRLLDLPLETVLVLLGLGLFIIVIRATVVVAGGIFELM